MTKENLKTLKNLTRNPTITGKDGRLIIEKELKAEAIKWTSTENLKKLREEFSHHTGPWKTGVHEFDDFHIWSEIEFANFVMNKFFNTFKEDLK